MIKKLHSPNIIFGLCLSLMLTSVSVAQEAKSAKNCPNIDNPILSYVNGTTVITEFCDPLEIPKIGLCQGQDMLLETFFVPNAVMSISWERLNAGGNCINDPNDPCSFLVPDCNANWAEVPGGNTINYTVSEAGDYRISVEFIDGCVAQFYFGVNQIIPIVDILPIRPTDCDPFSGALEIQVFEGLPEYQFTISGGTLQSPIVVPNEAIFNGMYQQQGLESGTYTVEVISGLPVSQCVDFYTAFIDPANNYELLLDMNPITCGNNGTVFVTNANELPNFAYSLTSGGPYDNTTGVFSIPPGSGGDVAIYAIDTLSANCEYTELINVIEIDSQITADIAVTPVSTNADGMITLTPSGGSPAYTYELMDAQGTPVVSPQSSNIITVAMPGDYVAVVTDAIGCSFTQNVVVESTEQNPLLEYADEILFCAITGQSYPNITIQNQNGDVLDIPLAGIASIVWQKLNDINCTIPAPENCPTTDASCESDWITLCTTADCNVSDPGEYRVVIQFTRKSVNSTQTLFFKAGTVLDVADQQSTRLSIFPNPVEDKVNIQGLEMSPTKIEVFDITGKKVLETRDTAFNMLGMEKSVYFVNVTTAKGTSVLKLLKE